MTKYVRAFLISSVLVCLTALVIFQTGGTQAVTSEHWITVDSSELQQIMANRGAKDQAGLATLRIAQLLGDIAVLKLNDQQMEELSRAMHDNFHKCGGYMAHASESEAVEWVRLHQTATTESQFVTYTIDNPQTVNAMIAATSEPYNRQVIIDLSAFPNRRHNQPTGLQSANWIKDKWTSLAAGLSRGEATVEFFNHTTTPQPSVVMTFRGTRFPDEIVVVGAHQDSINSSGSTQPAPGADDDASGVACLTEAIRVMIATGFKPERTVQFMAYAAEEVGLFGSKAISTAYRDANKNVIGVMQLDMTNYRGTQGYDIAMITDNTNAAQNQFLRDLITTYQPGLNVTNTACGYSCSDHQPWHSKGYAASFPFEAPIGNDNSAIHTANDTIARSNNNANHAMRFTKLALSYVAELAKGCLILGSRCQNSLAAK